jgi:hypothetical protein
MIVEGLVPYGCNVRLTGRRNVTKISTINCWPEGPACKIKQFGTSCSDLGQGMYVRV